MTLKSFLSLLILAVPTISFAMSDYGAVSSATAGSGRAAVNSAETPSLNPATLPFSRGYFFTSSYSMVNQGYAFNVALTDAMPDTLVPTSLIYQQVQTEDKFHQQTNTQEGQLEFANYYNKNLSLGMGVDYRMDEYLSNRWTQTNVILGGLYTLSREMGIALVFNNLLPQDNSVPVANRLYNQEALGFNYNYQKMVRFKVDLLTATNNSLDGFTIATGLESYWNQWLVMRLGIQKNLEMRQDFYGAGVGFVGPKFVINYGYLNCGEDDRLSRHAIDFAVPIW